MAARAEQSAPTRAGSFARIALVYTVAGAAALVAGWLPDDRHPLFVAGAADLAAALVVFGFSVLFDNTSVYDPYWSVAVPPLALFYALGPFAAGADAVRKLVVVGLAALWAVRLTWNWARGWRGIRHEDWRYVDVRNRTGRLYWPASLVALQLMPTVMVFLGCLSLYVALALGMRPFGPLDGVAAVVTLAAIAIEAAADRQLRRFVLSSPPAGSILQTGLWAWSRHPNYFGEVLLWWGLFLFAVAAAPFRWWMLLGPVAITLLFVGVSIPLIERRMLARRSGFAERQRRVSALVPWFPRRA